MDAPHSDALVFFGATGDLAHKKIFPALQAMVKHGHLSVPVIGVAPWRRGSRRSRRRSPSCAARWTRCASPERVDGAARVPRPAGLRSFLPA
jgi:glucose-6-phosphate 1-dehydrogenase